MQAIDDRAARRPARQDTYDLRDQIATDEQSHHSHDMGYPSDEEHSVLEDDSDGENGDDYMDDDDGSSSLSIPNESIDFDLVYALHSFAATVEGQANVVKGDSLFLMDDSNSYWWLVRVLKTQEVGYIPAENIETPFERLARLNKHRNVDLASATQAELAETRDRLLSSRTGSNHASPSPTTGGSRAGPRARSHSTRSVIFNAGFNVHRYPPAVWGDEEEEDEEDIEWDDEDYSDIDPDLAEDFDVAGREKTGSAEAELLPGMEPDDGISWEPGAVEGMRAEQQGSQGQVIITSSTSDVSLEQQEDAARTRQVAQQRLQQDQQRNVSPASQQASPTRAQSSQERTVASQSGASSGSPTSPVGKVMDPLAVTETRKVSITPAVARSVDEFQPSGPLLPSEVMRQQSEEHKRTREEIEALEQEQRKKANKGSARAGSGTPEQRAAPGKLRKEHRPESATDDEGGKDKKKKGGVLAGLFGRKKDKGKDKNAIGISSDNGSLASGGSVDNVSGRNSAESGRSSSQQHSTDGSSPVTSSARQQQQQAMQQVKNSADPRRAQGQAPQSGPGSIHPQISQHASQLRQRDQQQQALYQQYLNRSPSSPPEAQPSYGLQSASAIMGSTSFSSTTSSSSGLTAGGRQRPGSLILSPGGMDGQGVGLPDLSVIRVFAGENLQTEATFKTVLLNNSTTASDLVRQAIQRFRLSTGDSEGEYYLTIKQVEGSSAQLMPHEKPLGVFESLVEAAMELPKVKRSSVGSISSVASNLSMHPAIKKLPMNDFTDDSAVKFYLNRKRGEKEASITDDADDTLMAESVDDETGSPRSNHFLTINGATVTPERFSSPSVRFALQLAIHPEDLPDDMVFDPLTEAIVFKDTLRDRSRDIIPSPGISQNQRKKVFVFPKNVNVAEVIEQGLERFGIAEGVVDGGDEVEDKLAKRRSSSRVRYCLAVEINGSEKELAPTSKVIDAYPRPPAYRRSVDNKRRSVDSTILLGSSEDVGPDDPVFILRRAVAYRPSSRRLSAPLDEIALQKLHRASLSISSVASDSTAGPDESKKQMSKQEIIAAQRAARSANQRAILSAEANSSRGLDVRLPGNAMIRSSRHELDDRMRYSYMDASGTTYDISDIVEAEWQSEVGPNRSDASSDLLHGVLSRGNNGLGAKLDRVLSQVRHPRAAPRAQPVHRDSADSARSGASSVYSTAEGGPTGSRSATPNAQTLNARSPTPTSTAAAAIRTASPLSRLSSYRTASEGESDGRRTATPSSGSHKGARPLHDRQQSLASVMSDSSLYRSQSPTTPQALVRAPSATPKPPRPVLPRDDFGLAHMLALIEFKDAPPAPHAALPPLDPVDALLFGRELDLDGLHPQIRDIYASTFKQLDDMDHSLDELLQHVAHAF